MDAVVCHRDPLQKRKTYSLSFQECYLKMALSCQLSLGTTSAEESCLAQGHSSFQGGSPYKDWSTWGTNEFPAPYSNSGQDEGPPQLQSSPLGHLKPLLGLIGLSLCPLPSTDVNPQGCPCTIISILESASWGTQPATFFILTPDLEGPQAVVTKW